MGSCPNGGDHEEGTEEHTGSDYETGPRGTPMITHHYRTPCKKCGTTLKTRDHTVAA